MSGIRSNFKEQAVSVQLQHAGLVDKGDSSHEEQSWQNKLMKATLSRREMTPEGVSKAVSIIESVLQEHRTPVGYYLLAEAYLNLTPANNEAKIVKAYRDAIGMSPKFQEAYRQLGTFHFRSGEYKEALEVYLEWGNLFPKRGEIWRRIADIYTALKETEEAGKFLMLAVSRGRKDRIDREQFTLQDEEDMIIYGE